MADEFLLKMHHECGVGGLACPCCNHTISSRDKGKALLRRHARRKMKQEHNKSIKEVNDEQFDSTD